MQTRENGWKRDGYNTGAWAPGNEPRAHPFALWMHLISHLFVRIAEFAITSPSYKRAAICRPIVNRPLRLDSRVINRGYCGEFMFTVAMRVFTTAEEETSRLSRAGNVKSVAAVDYFRLEFVDNPFMSHFAKTEFSCLLKRAFIEENLYKKKCKIIWQNYLINNNKSSAFHRSWILLKFFFSFVAVVSIFLYTFIQSCCTILILYNK